jgi:tripartite-type tricarboxylate transporter receptor subunit TctC
MRGAWARLIAATAALAALVSLQGAPLAAEDAVAKFYAKHPIDIIVPYGPGGYYDIGARLIARYWGKYIPGRPSIVVENQPSAGGIGLAERFIAGLGNDGTQVGVLQRAVPQYALIGYQGAKFDPTKLTWIGSLSSYAHDSYVLVVNSDHPAKSIEDLRAGKVPTRIGAGRSGSANLLYALIAQDLLKIKVDIVRGYDGTAPIFLAMQSHEVDGVFADLSTISVAAANQWRDKQIVPVVQMGRKTRLPELGDVPSVREMISSPDDLKFLDFAELPFFIALPVAAPAGIPADRARALSAGFMAMGRDPQFLDEARRMKFEVSPIDGAAVDHAIDTAAAAPESVKDRFLRLVSQ